MHLSSTCVLAAALVLALVSRADLLSSIIALVGHADDTAGLSRAACTGQETAPCDTNPEHPLSLLLSTPAFTSFLLHFWAQPPSAWGIEQQAYCRQNAALRSNGFWQQSCGITLSS